MLSIQLLLTICIATQRLASAQHSCSFIAKLDVDELAERRSAAMQLNAVNSPLNVEYNQLELVDDSDVSLSACSLGNARLAIVSPDLMELRLAYNGSSSSHLRQCLLAAGHLQFQADTSSPASCRFYVEFLAVGGDVGDDDASEEDTRSLLSQMISYYAVDVSSSTDRDSEDDDRRRHLDVPLDSLLPKLVGRRPYAVVCVKCATSLQFTQSAATSHDERLRISSTDKVEWALY
jgi:hypothetical protein